MTIHSPDAESLMFGVSAALGRPTQAIQPNQVRIQGTASGVDTFRAEAVDALVHIASNGRRGKPSALAARGPIPIMRQSLVLHGSASAAHADDHVIADATAQVMASGVNRVGDFVNIMSAVQQNDDGRRSRSPELSFRFISPTNYPKPTAWTPRPSAATA
jgi:hypothetical protein